jgi:hypothetical protein
MHSFDERSSFIEPLHAVLDWARSRDFKGNDPHDLLESPFLKNVSSSNLRLAFLQLGRRSPIDLRPIFRVPPMENPKALALFIAGLECAKQQATTDWCELSSQLTARMFALQNVNGGWGYPFAWQSRTHYLPANTPTVVCTAFCGNALLDVLIGTDDRSGSAYPKLREAILNACSYITTRLPRTPDGGFGYAENDPQIVFNATALAAAFLARVGEIFEDDDAISFALQSAKFVIRYQEKSGAWKYGLEATQTWSDSFHTGYVLDSLHTIGYALNDNDILLSAERGFEYYRKHFFLNDGTPKYYDNKTYPIDTHSAAQAIITLLRFDDRDMAERVATWTIDHMQAKDGHFYYQKTRLYTNPIAYMRWSNAWMFRALSTLVKDL